MPGMDGSGPLGSGPIGRGSGPCGGGQSGWGAGRGLRRGGGRGWNRMPAPLSPEDQKQLLERRKGWLEAELASIAQRLQGEEKRSE